jgi:Ca2+/H+ antiporter, TMEM165/GDT1 family
MAAFFLSFAMVFAAEFGDKTQIVALAFATRYRAAIVLAGISIASLLSHFLSVALGQMAGSLLPRAVLNVVAGLAFLAFGVLTMRGEKGDGSNEGDAQHRNEHKFGPIVSVASTFFIAELGDKTMLATVTIASQQQDFLGVWLGSSIGMILAGAVAIWLGNVLGKRIPAPLVRAAGAIIFIVTGIFTLARAALAQ